MKLGRQGCRYNSPQGANCGSYMVPVTDSYQDPKACTESVGDSKASDPDFLHHNPMGREIKKRGS
jgi:hypothetical protein